MTQRQTYPIPDGYRMLRPGEIIKENDLRWNDTGWSEVPKIPEYIGGADPDKHPCIIRACLVCAECKQNISENARIFLAMGKIVCSESCQINWLDKNTITPTTLLEARVLHETADRIRTAMKESESVYWKSTSDVPEEKRSDMIRPNYYKQGGIEVISIIKLWKLGFNLGNVIKYVLRAGLKSENRLEDLRKANTYLQFELQEEHEKDGNQ